MPPITVDTSALTGSGVNADVAEPTPGNEPSGRFLLQADTAPRGWPEHRSGWISVGSTAIEVEQAVIQIPGIQAADVNVNASLPTVGPIAWEITFSHRRLEEASEEVGGDVDSIGTVSGNYVATGQSGDRPSLRVVRAQLAGSGAVAEAETLHDGDLAIGGKYDIYLRGDREATTTAVKAGASAADVRLALVEGLGIPGTTDVVREGPLDDSLAYTWTVTLPEGTTLWGNVSGEAAGGVGVNASHLSGKGDVFVESSLVRAGAVPVGGKFNVSLAEAGGEEEEEGRWVTVPHNATASDIADAVSSFLPSGGNVSVSSEDIVQGGDGSSALDVVTGKRWSVTFMALTAAGDVPPIEVNGSSGLLTGSGARVYANETSKGVTADVQEMVIDGYRGTLAFYSAETDGQHVVNISSVDSVSSPLQWNATSSDVATALFEATGKRVYVERSPVTSAASSTSGGYAWLVLFAEALNGTWGSIGLNVTNLVPDDDYLAGSSRQANLTLVRNSTADAAGGGFSLRFGQSCHERAGGVYCSVAETPQLRFDSPPDEVVAALEALPAVIDASVTTTGTDGNDSSGSGRTSFWGGGAGKIAPDDFGVSSAGASFRVTLSSVVLNVSDSALAEYWRRTWTPEMSATEWSGELATGGDLPLLEVDVTGLVGSHAAGQAKEVVKGMSTEVGGVVAVEVSQNAGRDYTTSGVTYVYEALVSVSALIPDHGPSTGGTEVS